MSVQHLRSVVPYQLFDFTVQLLNALSQCFTLSGQARLRIGFQLGIDFMSQLIGQDTLELGRQCAYRVGPFYIILGITFNRLYMLPHDMDCLKLC